MPHEHDSYHVVFPEPVRAALNGYVEALLQAGWNKAAVRALLQEMDDRLRDDADEFGEPHYTLRKVKIRISIGFVRPLSIQFGLHEESRSVFVRKIVLMTTKKEE